MGDPRRLRKKYSGPGHPWQLARIQEEKALKYQYGLTTKRELWKMNSMLKAFANQAKRLIALRTKQSEIESQQLLESLARIGLLAPGAKLNDVLGLTVSDMLDRRLQTVVFKKGLARTAKQARQFITHGHITIAGKTFNAPSYIVPLADEAHMAFVAKSTLANPDHPERTTKTVVPKAEEKPEAEAEA